MKLLILMASVLLTGGARPSAQGAGLTAQVVTAEDAGFFVNSALLVGRTSVMLVDAQLTRAGALKVIDAIRETGKPLTLIYVTHSHADHFLALDTFRTAYPNVRIIATSQVRLNIQAIYLEKLEKWQGLLKADAANDPVEIIADDSDIIVFDSVRIEVMKAIAGDTPDCTMLYVPSSRTLITGDVTFVGMHVYTPETDASARMRWLRTLADIRRLRPAVVIPGHQRAGSPIDATTAVDFTEAYLRAYEIELARARTASDLIARMKVRYPDAELVFSLERSALARFTQRPLSKPQ